MSVARQLTSVTFESWRLPGREGVEGALEILRLHA
jgi:hypothetical protein